MSLAGSLRHSLRARFGWLMRSSVLRLSVVLSLIFAVGMALSISVGLILGQQAVSRQVDVTLRSLAETLAADEVPPERTALIVRPLTELGDLPPAFGRAADAGGGPVRLRRDFGQSEEWRALVAEDAAGVPILIALPLSDSDDAVEIVGAVLWTTAGLVFLMTIATGVTLGLFAQRRLARISDTLDRLAAGDLGARTGAARHRDDLDDIARELDSTATELERLVQQTRHLSASIAHDLRTPLARLRAQLELLPESEGRGAALEEAGRLSAIFDTIMRVARIEAGQGTDGFTDVDLRELTEDIAETFGPVVEDAGKELIVTTVGAGTVRADRGMLVQALANLIQNAIVHGGNTIRLSAGAQNLSVSDNGAGVPPEAMAEIVKPMVRLDAARTRDGTGLGLALVKAVADRHRARLVLAPSPEGGLSVTLNLANL